MPLLPILIMLKQSLVVLTLAVFGLFGPAPHSGMGTRYAVSADGNFHDPDDIGATPMTLALLWRASAQDRLVLYEHSSHLGANNGNQQAEMVTSATGNLVGFKIDPDVVRDVQNPVPPNSKRSLAGEINRSTSTDRLVIIQAGPWESVVRAFLQSNPKCHRYVTIITHHPWNDGHEHLLKHRNRWEFQALYEPGGIESWQGQRPPTIIRIDDQNDYAFRTTNASAWNWLDNHPNLQFVKQRGQASGVFGDFSDAGMMFFCLTGIEHPTMTDVRNFFGYE